MSITDLRNDLDIMAVITRKLNGPDNARTKNYKHLARVCGIPAEKYESLQPPGAESPTEEVIRDIVGRKPFYTVSELITDLHGMNRVDAIKAIRPFFVGKNCGTSIPMAFVQFFSLPRECGSGVCYLTSQPYQNNHSPYTCRSVESRGGACLFSDQSRGPQV